MKIKKICKVEERTTRKRNTVVIKERSWRKRRPIRDGKEVSSRNIRTDGLPKETEIFYMEHEGDIFNTDKECDLLCELFPF